jgi:hypothetical protein
VTVVCASAYAASLMTMLGTCYLLSKTSLSPANVQTSMATIYNTMATANGGCETIAETDEDASNVDTVSNMIVASISSADSHDSQVGYSYWLSRCKDSLPTRNLLFISGAKLSDTQ